MSNSDQATITNVGILSETPWSGSISAAAIRDTAGLSLVDAEAIVQTLNNYFVASSPKAPERCIDGRLSPRYDEQSLGVQVPGGSLGAALALRLVSTINENDNFLNDAHTLLAALEELEVRPGAHRDTHSDGIAKTGCGAIDGMDRALAALAAPENEQSIAAMTNTLLGNDFDSDTFSQLITAARELNSRHQSYFENRLKITDELEARDPESVVTLEGVHNEIFVIVNLAAGTTFAGNRFEEENDGLQAFNYDFWRTLQLADQLFNDLSEKTRFITARVVTAIATLMILTDGSQQLIVRK